MSDTIDIRPAQPGDAEVAAVLLYSAFTHTPVPYPLPATPGQGWIQRLQAFFQQDGNRFSYQNAWVAVQQGAVVGMALGFAGFDELRLNAAVGDWLVREAHDDEWYVDALAVFQNWGRQGIGARLLRTMEQQARQRGCTTVALRVADDNQQALAFYRHLHYQVMEQTVLYQQRYLRMIKRLEYAEEDSPDQL